jgi:hypothetical protein
VVEEQCGRMGISFVPVAAFILYDFIESVGHRIMAHRPVVRLRQIRKTVKTKMLLIQQKPLSANDA